MEKTAVIFDLDGTLWNAIDVIIHGWNDTIKKHGKAKTMTKEELESYMGKSMQEIADIHFTNLGKEERYALAIECEKVANALLTANGATAYDGVCEMMDKLSKKHSIFMVSNCQDGYIEAFLNNHGTKKYVSDFEYIGRTGKKKSENIKAVVARNNITRAVYVGDTEHDYEATREAGLEFIFAAYGFGDVKDAKYVAKNTSDIVKLVNEIL